MAVVVEEMKRLFSLHLSNKIPLFFLLRFKRVILHLHENRNMRLVAIVMSLFSSYLIYLILLCDRAVAKCTSE